MQANLIEVTQNINKYFRGSLPQYTAIEIRKSHTILTTIACIWSQLKNRRHRSRLDMLE